MTNYESVFVANISISGGASVSFNAGAYIPLVVVVQGTIEFKGNSTVDYFTLNGNNSSNILDYMQSDLFSFANIRIRDVEHHVLVHLDRK